MNANMLQEYDFTVVVDSSSSMGEPNKGTGGRTRWEAMQESAIGLTRDIEKLDSDGIDVVQLGGSVQKWEGVGVDKLREIFAGMGPRGSTPLAEALEKALSSKSNKKKFIVVFTDGVPDDEVAAAEVIKKQANRQTSDEDCTILFIQIGDDKHASAYLRQLDDNLKGAKFDIVDAKTIEEAEKFATTTDLILAAIED